MQKSHQTSDSQRTMGSNEHKQKKKRTGKAGKQAEEERAFNYRKPPAE